MKMIILFLMSLFAIGSWALPGIDRNDFQVSGPNSDTALNNSQIFCDAQGNYTVLWSQINTGLGGGFRIHARQFTSAHIARGDAIEMTAYPKYTSTGEFSGDMNDDGFFAVTWKREFENTHEILARRFNPNGTPFDNVPVVMNDSTDKWVGNIPDIAINNQAHTLVTWRQENNGTNAYTYSAFMNAALSQPNVKFLLDDVDEVATNPRIALSNNFRIILVSNKGEGLSLRGRLFGYILGVVPITDEFIVKDQGNSNAADVDMMPGGEFVVVYEDENSGGNDIFAKRYDSTGTLLGSEIQVEYNINTDGIRKPHVNYGKTGQFIFSWEAPVTKAPRIRIYNKSGQPAGAAIQVYEDAYHTGMGGLHACLDGNNRALVAMTRDKHSIFVTPYSTSGNITGPAIRVNDLGSDAAYADAAIGKSTGYGAVVWELYGQDKIQLMLMGYDQEKKTTSISVDGPGSEFNPAVALDDTVFVFWNDFRPGETDTTLYYQRYSMDGDLIGSQSRINDLGSVAKRPAVAISNNRVMAVWEDRRVAQGNTSHIYGQIMNESGGAVGGNFFISENVLNGFLPDVDAATDTFAVVWSRVTTSGGPLPTTSSQVYMRLFDRNGTAITEAFNVNTSGNGYNPKVSMSYYGTFVVAWIQTGSGISLNRQIYFQRFKPNGDTIGVNTRADTGIAPKSYPGVAVNSGGIRLSWQVNGSDVTVESRDFNMNNDPPGEVRSHLHFSMRSPIAAPALTTNAGYTLLVWMNSNHTDVGKRDIWGEYSSFNGGTWLGTKRNDNFPSNNIDLTRKIIPFPNQLWMNKYSLPVSIYNSRGSLIGRVDPEKAFQFPTMENYFIKIDKSKTK